MKTSEREKNLAAMLDSTSFLMTLIGRDLVYREVNRAYLEARGLRREQVVGKRVTDLWSADVLDTLVGSSLERALGGETVRYQAVFEVSPGDLRAMDVTMDPVLEPGGEITRVVVATRDRSEERELVEELEEARRALEESEAARATLLARLGGDLGGPLERLQAWLEALDGEGETARLSRLREGRRTVSDLLARLDDLAAAGGLPQRRDAESFRLAPFLEELGIVQGRMAIAHGLLLAVDAPADLPREVRGQRTRLHALLSRLLERAADGMDQGTLELKVRRQESGELVFEVAGGGRERALPAELSREAERLSARLEPATGTFGARLVLAVAELAPPAPRLGRPRILVVDDNPVNLEVVREQLERRGLETVLAASGQEALGRLAEESFDLALMDSRMPGLDGFAVTQLRRRQEAAAGLPRLAIVAFTANAGPGDRETCLAAGMDDYLSKPLRAAELDRVLACWLPEPAEEVGATLDAEALALIDDPNDASFLAELVEIFLADCPPRLEALTAAALRGDLAGAGDAAHSLKSSAANLGAVALATLAQRVSDLARAGADAAPLEELAAAVQKEYARASAALRCFVAGRT